jgi:hypothetical protein
MAELLSGPWHIAATQVDMFPKLELEITDSADTDGRYPIEEGLELIVVGDEWRFEIGSVDWAGEGWRPVEELRRETSFIPLEGLTIVFDTRPHPPSTGGWWFGPLYVGAALTFTSQDPEISPVPSTGLPDFSIPKGGARRREG